MRVAIIAIGDELLSGKTLDYNSHWISKRLFSLGFRIALKITVGDEENEIVEALKLCMRKADIIITTGGLGPTPGDVTLSAIAKALNKKLVRDNDALEMIKRRYRELYEIGFIDSPDITKEREKMAILPEGAKPFYNPIGVAPGVLIKYRGKYIIALPGVPSEMMYLLEAIIPNLPILRGKTIVSREWYIDFRDESLLAKILEEIMQKFKGNIRIKSYPVGFGRQVRMRIIAVVENMPVEKAEELLRNVWEELTMRISNVMGNREHTR
ncbi:MAG: competence/damage-inducible protein A [Candidatus Njordarchaeales archaeon]